MKRTLLLLSMALSACLFLNAQQRSQEEVRDIAHIFYNNVYGHTASTRAEESLELIPSSRLLSLDAAEEIFYLCNSQQDGYVLVSADMRMPELLGYSDRSYDADKGLPPALLEVMSGYAALVDEPVVTRATSADVTPLIQTRWNQDDPFNRMCPRDGGKRSVTGCAATAAAQILKYYEWPKETSKQTISYRTFRKDIAVKINLEDYSFAWDLMRDEYIPNLYTNAQANAVAKLMFAVGAACETDYASTESSSSLYNCMLAMVKYFGYDKDMCLLTAGHFSAEGWEEMLQREIYERRPVMMGASSTNVGKLSGHAFLLDGYQQKGNYVYYHVNWGWGGDGDGYYRINNFTPKDEATNDMGMGTFTTNQIILINFQPDDGKDNTIYALLEKMDLIRSDEADDLQFKLKVRELSCIFGITWEGTLCVEFVDENGVAQQPAELGYCSIDPGYYISKTYDVRLGPLNEGKYTVRPFLKSKNGRRIEILSERSLPVLTVSAAQESAIRDLQQEVLEKQTYDLQGREKKNAGKLPAGFYIVNGKKVVLF